MWPLVMLWFAHVGIVVECWTAPDQQRLTSSSSTAATTPVNTAPIAPIKAGTTGRTPNGLSTSLTPTRRIRPDRRRPASHDSLGAALTRAVSMRLGGLRRFAARTMLATQRLGGTTLAPHARSLGGVWLYLRGTSSARRRAAALAELIEPATNLSYAEPEGDSSAAAIIALLAAGAEERRVATKQLWPLVVAIGSKLTPSRVEERPLRVLCLDGGGMKGRNLLVMIRELERISGKPVCELFDVVCGTSIGGCGALFVSRFGPDAADQAEIAFKGLQRRCFATSSHKRFLQQGQCCTDHRAELVRELLGGVDVPLLDESPGRPLAFVVAARRNPVDGDPEPFLFRNYKVTYGGLPPLPGTSNATLIDAVVATSAAPVYFAPSQGPDDFFLADGGCAFNNPSLVAIHELRAVFPRRRIGCLVSLGCGQAPSDLAALRTRLVYRSNLPEEIITHEYAQALLRAIDGAVYERLDPPLPASISPAEHRDTVLDEMERHTVAWLRQPDISDRIRRIATHLSPLPSYSVAAN